LVNTYGAFGTVGRERLTVVFQGTDSDRPNGAEWKDYPYLAQPVDVRQRPRQIAPYQPRLDWQMWFAAMQPFNREYAWTLNLTWKLLHNDPGTLSLFGGNPFPDHPPRYIRAVLYRYRFAPPRNPQGLWWTRETVDMWLPPLSAQSAELQGTLRTFGWLPPEDPVR
ncbi:MAG TPA: lipase maturation factor family protein, partial [Opitutaceae bacterium]|nr:lipase maturation factor family protein [Opitutaceae bacterium]